VGVGLYQFRKVEQKGVHLKLHPEENEYKEHTTKGKKRHTAAQDLLQGRMGQFP